MIPKYDFCTFWKEQDDIDFVFELLKAELKEAQENGCYTDFDVNRLESAIYRLSLLLHVKEKQNRNFL